MEEEVDVHFTDREWWTLIHGMGFGALFLLGFAGGLAGLYRDPAPDSPRSTLLADSATKDWHHFGMEWKEHVAWLSPYERTGHQRARGVRPTSR